MPAGKLGLHPLKAETYNIAVRTGNFRNDSLPVFLNGVRARLVQWVDEREVIPDLSNAERVEANVGPFGEYPSTTGTALDQADPGYDGVSAPLQFAEHPGSVRAINGLSKELCFPA